MRLYTTVFAVAVCILFTCGEPGYAKEPCPEKGPVDYTATNIAFTAHDGVELFGRLVLPKSNAPRAIVIYVQTAEGATSSYAVNQLQ